MRGILRATVGLALLALLVGVLLPAESEGQAAKPAAKAAAQAKPAEPKPPAQRRDPFRSLLSAAGPGGTPACVAPGKAGLMVGQLAIVGIVMTPNDSVAVANASGRNRAYFLRERDELCDGYVSRITEDNVIFREKSKDAYGRSFEKEVVKQITAGSGAKR